MFSSAVPILSWHLCFGKKGNGTWGRNALFDTMNDPADVVEAIEQFANTSRYNNVSAVSSFVDEEKDGWKLIF